MTLKRLVLTGLTFFVVFLVGSSLIGSWSEPQITSRLQLYQTDLLLQATEFQPEASGANVDSTRTAILGKDPIATSLEQYEDVRQTAQTELDRFQSRLDQVTVADAAAPEFPTSSSDPSKQGQLRTAIRQQQTLIDQLDLRIGILQVEQGQVETALETWSRLTASSNGTRSASDVTASDTRASDATAPPPNRVAETLTGLWSQPPRLLPDVEQQIQENLDGWFRDRALSRLYELQQRPDAISALQQAAQAAAQQTFLKLTLIGVVPIIGCLAGTAILISLLVQRAFRGEQALLAQNGTTIWETPWSGEIVWQVLIAGFFFAGQIVLPLASQLLGIGFSAFDSRARAAYALLYYLAMAGISLFVLYLSIRKFLPLPQEWFRLKSKSNWFLWGGGGYLVALPLMIVVSWINQQVWQGQGGSNPLLQIVLEEGDPIALGMFFATASIAAPIFEEILFRGFLLPSLTRYMSVGWAIALSSLIFATAHLSLAEVLPLTLLGAVLGFVYTRSRSLLSPILLHSLWNSVTMIGLFLLGSGAE
ncbi:CPBP family intramembrane metalloprotease [Oculatella sp. FACHB-28]|nr:CPBP family intramembrane metalloprotease [Oculatella sp. FACHB-28]